MAKTYTLTSTISKGGVRQGYSGDWDGCYLNNNGETRLCGQVNSGGLYASTYYMFNSTTLNSLKTKTITSIKLTITIPSTAVPGSGTDLYVVREKVNNATGSDSSSSAWKGGSNILSYVARDSGSSRTFDLDLTSSNTIPTYGYVLGPYAQNQGKYIDLDSTATLTVITDEPEFENTIRIVNGSNLDLYKIYVVENNNLVPYRATIVNGSNLVDYS